MPAGKTGGGSDRVMFGEISIGEVWPDTRIIKTGNKPKRGPGWDCWSMKRRQGTR